MTLQVTKPLMDEVKKKDVFRQEYTPLTDQQKEQVQSVKAKAQELWDMIEEMVPANERSERARLVNVGKTDIEKGVMMVVKGLTGPQE